MNLKFLLTSFFLIVGINITSNVQAALVSEGGGNVVYDTDLNITWLSNANLAATNTFGVSGIGTDGSMNWTTAQSWITAMNTAKYLGYSDWRLPTADPACGFNYNCTGSELGNLFYQEFGVTARNSILTGNAAALAKFSNIQNADYWTGTAYEPDPYYVWAFTADGQQNGIDNIDSVYVWAMRSGRVNSATNSIVLDPSSTCTAWGGSTVAPASVTIPCTLQIQDLNTIAIVFSDSTSINLTRTSPISSSGSINLTGEWIGNNYTCGSTQAEPVSIIQNGSFYQATKITGDGCVPAGHVTFYGNLILPILPVENCLFNWAETGYPSLFAPTGSPTVVSTPYTYRYYSTTNSYLRVSLSTNHVYYQQGSNGKLLDVGSLAQWLPLAGCQVLAPPPTECLFNWAERNLPSLFAPTGTLTSALPPYTYRHYIGTNSYLAVSSIDNHIYYVGSNGIPQDAGPTSYWLSQSGCQ